MVKDGSKGLYKLSVQDIEPDIAGASVDLNNVTFVTDSAILHRLDSMHLAPDDVFAISFKKLHIEGLGIGELISKKSINLDKITNSYPVVTV
mgnify:FL=1